MRELVEGGTVGEGGIKEHGGRGCGSSLIPAPWW